MVEKGERRGRKKVLFQWECFPALYPHDIRESSKMDGIDSKFFEFDGTISLNKRER